MNLLRIIVAVALTVLIHRHACWWGHCFFTLHGMRSPLETPVGYLLPSHRLWVVYLLHFALIVGVWLVFPYGQWGLLVILVSTASHKIGRRWSLLYHFANHLLIFLKSGDSLDDAWEKASAAVSCAVNLRNPNVDPYRIDPGVLMSCAAFAMKRPTLVKRWACWLQSQSGADADDLVADEVDRMASLGALRARYCLQIGSFISAFVMLSLVAGVILAAVNGTPWWWGPAAAAVCFVTVRFASAGTAMYFRATTHEYRKALAVALAA